MSDYNFPLYFDIAFQYRDIGKECDFAEAVLEMHNKTENRSILDINCGTGRHILEFLERGYDVDGFDISEEMLEYIRNDTAFSKYSPTLWQDNLKSFKPKKKYGLLTNMLTSFNYILINKDVLVHFESAANALAHGGIYIIELNHPRDMLSSGTSAPNNWTEERDGIQIEMDWDYKNAPLDYIRQTYALKGKMKIIEEKEEKILTSSEEIRIYLYQEMKALIELSGWFTLIGSYGSFNPDHALGNSDSAWRMILALRKD